MSDHARLVRARVFWNQALIARAGHRDRFNIRLVVAGTTGMASVVLAERSTAQVPVKVQSVSIRLGKAKAAVLGAATDVVLAVSQQYGDPKRADKRFDRNYATITHLPKTSRGFLTAGPNLAARSGRGCRLVLIGAGVDAGKCDLAGANLRRAYWPDCDVSGANLAAALLTSGDISRCVIADTIFADASLTGVVSGGLIGTPASLPTGWTLTNGSLHPPASPAPTPDPTPAPAASVAAATSQTVAFTSAAPASATVGGSTYTPTAAASSGLVVELGIDPVAAAVCVVSGAVVHFIGAGSCVVNANQAGDSSYTAAAQVQQGFTVAAATGGGGTTPVAATCAAGGTCVVGDTGPGGGTVFYITGGTRYEAAPTDWDLSGDAADPTIAWCNINATLLIGTFGTAVGTGEANTTLMATQCTSGAGFTARAYTGGSQNDWSLPSKDELNQLCRYANTLDTTSTAVCTAGTLRTGFTAGDYWSSSQYDAFNAWDQSFSNGSQSSPFKGLTDRVRPVRAF